MLSGTGTPGKQPGFRILPFCITKDLSLQFLRDLKDPADIFLSDIQLYAFFSPHISVSEIQDVRKLQTRSQTDLKQNIVFFTGFFQPVFKFMQSLIILDR